MQFFAPRLEDLFQLEDNILNIEHYSFELKFVCSKKVPQAIGKLIW